MYPSQPRLSVRVLEWALCWVHQLLGPELASLWVCAFHPAQWQLVSLVLSLRLCPRLSSRLLGIQVTSSPPVLLGLRSCLSLPQTLSWSLEAMLTELQPSHICHSVTNSRALSSCRLPLHVSNLSGPLFSLHRAQGPHWPWGSWKPNLFFESSDLVPCFYSIVRKGFIII